MDLNALINSLNQTHQAASDEKATNQTQIDDFQTSIALCQGVQANDDSVMAIIQTALDGLGPFVVLPVPQAEMPVE
jgi:hypothetical protein